MLNKETVDKVWQSGYCRKVIAIIGRTELGSQGMEDRLSVVDSCIKKGCRDCRNAAQLKNYERDVAALCGDDVLQKFHQGEDIQDHPKFQHALQARLNTAVSRKEINKRFIEWLCVIKTTRMNGYPYHEQDFGSIS
jgi:hypothetical protein